MGTEGVLGPQVDHLVNFKNTELEPNLDWFYLNLILFLEPRTDGAI